MITIKNDLTIEVDDVQATPIANPLRFTVAPYALPTTTGDALGEPYEDGFRAISTPGGRVDLWVAGTTWTIEADGAGPLPWLSRSLGTPTPLAELAVQAELIETAAAQSTNN